MQVPRRRLEDIARCSHEASSCTTYYHAVDACSLLAGKAVDKTQLLFDWQKINPSAAADRSLLAPAVLLIAAAAAASATFISQAKVEHVLLLR